MMHPFGVPYRRHERWNLLERVMYCHRCGTQNHENNHRCVNCGEFLHRSSSHIGPIPRIPNHLAQSILVTLFCCLPFGIVAIVYSAQVNTKIQAGDIQGARQTSRMAAIWGWWSFGLGLLFGLCYFMLAVLAEAVSR